MVAGVNSCDFNLQLCSTTALRELLSIKVSPPIDKVIALGFVPKFVEFLNFSSHPQLQLEAAWALTNIASGRSEQTRIVIDTGAVPFLVKLFNSPSDDVREQAVWALGNIAGDSPQCRDFVLQSGALGPLLNQLTESSKLSMLRMATWALSNFCHGKPPPSFDLVRASLPTLARLIHSSDEVLIDACWALSYLSDCSNDGIQAVIDAGVCPRLVELLMHTSFGVQAPVLRIVGNIMGGDELQAQIIISNVSALPCLLALIGSPKKLIRKQACWAMSNITAGNRAHIAAVIDAGIIPPLIHILANDEFDVRKEAAWAICNFTSGGSSEQIRYLVTCGCLKPLCDLLSVTDARTIIIALEGLENMLRIGSQDAINDINTGGVNVYATMIDDADGLEKIETLQNHTNPDIFEKALSIIQTYFLMRF